MDNTNDNPRTEPQEQYVPRPRWQVWAARLGVVLFLILIAAQLLQIAGGGL